MYKARIIIGVTAFATVIGLNIRHALNDYGIAENAWIQTALATVDSVQSMKPCGEENGQTKYCHSRPVEKPGFADCDHYYTIIVAEEVISTHNGKILATQKIILDKFEGYDTRGWVYEIPDYSHMYVTDWDIKNGTYIHKIAEGSVKAEYHYEKVFIAASANDCIDDPEGSCVPNAGLETACIAAFGNGYGTN